MKKNMTALSVAQVSTALEALNVTCRMTFRDARAIYNLRKAFAEQRDVVATEEKKLIEKFHGSIADGRPRFTSPDEAICFAKEHSVMMSEKAEVEYEPVDLSVYADFIECTLDSIDVLDGIVIFEHEKDGE